MCQTRSSPVQSNRNCRFTESLAGIASVFLLVVIAAGCTSIPHRDFKAYRQAFAEARQASVPIVNDLGVAWREAAVALGDVAGGDDDWQTFDPAASVQPLSIDEQVMVRHQLWIVTERYAEVLAALADGRSPEQAEGLVLGFVSSVRALPLRHLTDMASGGLPLSGLIGHSLHLIEREVSARQFRNAVEAGGPMIGAILTAMQEEISDHYDLRLALNVRARRELEAAVQMTLLPAFLDIYTATGPHEGKPDLLAELNESLRAGFRYRDDQLLDAVHADSDVAISSSEMAQLVIIANEVQARGKQFAALREELLMYQHVLRTYHELLGLTRQGMTALREAEDGGMAPSVEEALISAAHLYWRYTQYQHARAQR